MGEWKASQTAEEIPRLEQEKQQVIIQSWKNQWKTQKTTHEYIHKPLKTKDF